MFNSCKASRVVVVPFIAAVSIMSCAEERDYAAEDASVDVEPGEDEDASVGGERDANGALDRDGSAGQASTGDITVSVGVDAAPDGAVALLDGAAPGLDGALPDGAVPSERDAKPSEPECTKDSQCDDENECNGVEKCDDGQCVSGEVEDEGQICEGATDAEFVCRDGNCLKSRCGDGLVDARLMEVCDDGNVTNGDGCNVNCDYSCTEHAQCNDGNVCNGEESCDQDQHVCVPGTKADDATECGTDRACINGRCLSTACGDGEITEGEECDDENLVEGDGCTADCQFDCEQDADCNDENVCTGQETCNLDTHECVPGEALTCDDEVPCTEDKCEPIGGCRFPIIDEDGDGQAPIFKGSECGTDCDDDNDQVFAGAGELCDGIDNNCDGDKDETATVWYPDCDGDGYALLDSQSVQQCEQPSSPTSCPSGSRGTWTIRPPTSSTDSDCWDSDPDIYPRTDAVWSTTGIEGRTDYAFDYNCSYSNEPRYTNVGVPTTSECSPLVLQPAISLPVEVVLLQTPPNANLLAPADDTTRGSNVQIICTGPSGWEAPAAPACGQPGRYSYCSGCDRVIEQNYLQACQ